MTRSNTRHPWISLPLCVAAFFLLTPAPAHAQACEKGACDELLTTARTANFGTVTLSRAQDLPMTVHGVSGGSVNASYLPATTDGPCLGFAATSPDHLLILNERIGDLEIHAASPGDAVLLVYGPDGWRCNDDADGLNPIIRGAFEPGTYRIWVAEYAAHANHDYALTLSTRGTERRRPAPDTPALDTLATVARFAHATLGGRSSASEAILDGTLSSDVSVDTLGWTETGTCSGRTSETPHHILTLSGRSSDTYLEAIATSGSVGIAMHGPQGWLCADSTEIAHMEASLTAGTYRIWLTTSAGGDDRSRRRGDTARQNARDTAYELYITTATSTRRDRRGHPDWRPGPTPGPRPVPVAHDLIFRGQFENVDVTFRGADRRDLHADCQRFMQSASGMNWVDDIVIFGTAHRNGPSYWSPATLCAISALNARPDRPDPGVPILSGSVEEVPFSIYGSSAEARDALSSYMHDALDGLWIDDVVIGSQVLRNRYGYWSITETIAILQSNILDPAAPRRGGFAAAGTMQSIPFAFQGATIDDVREACVAFYNSVLSDGRVDVIIVGSERRENRPGYWNASEACMIVTSLAERL